MGNIRPLQRRKHNPFASPSSWLSTRPFAPTAVHPSASLLPKDQPTDFVQAKGFGYSFEHMAVYRPDSEVIAGNESKSVALGETTDLSPCQLTADGEALAEQDQSMPIARESILPAHSSAATLQRVPTSASDPDTPKPPPVNRQAGTKRYGWSIEHIAITHNPLAPVQCTAANDASRISALPSTVQRQGKKPPQQASNDINVLYENAGLAFEELKQFTRQFAEKTGGIPVIPDDLKKRDKAMKKVASPQYGGDASRLLDIARTTITYSTLAQVDAARAQIESSLQQFAPNVQIVRVKDRFANPTESGYRDYLANIQMSNGHITELQLHLSSIEAEKAKEHELYDIVQDIKDNASRQGRPLTAEEQARIDELNKRSQEIYRKALEGKSGQ